MDQLPHFSFNETIPSREGCPDVISGRGVSFPEDKQACPSCGEPIGICAGTKDAICKNCGFKDPCCE